MYIQNIIKHVFGNEFLQDLTSHVQSKNPDKIIGEEWDYTLEDVKFTINNILKNINPKQSIQDGRIGPTETVFDTEIKSRLISYSPDKLTATCSLNRGSGTAKANSALYKGKWQYEVQLGTCGIMQVGWCTLLCKFVGDTGVGDTPHSYAYDGQRKKKWNVSAQNYGETWLAGDIIGTAIDLDEGIIEFYRNGFSMGIAFEQIQTGPGMAYLPAISLSSGEIVVANFGGTPFKYPLLGYEPIQLAPVKDTMKANMLLNWMGNLLALQEMKPELQVPAKSKVSGKVMLYLFISLLFRNLIPLLNKTYVTEASLLPFIKRLIFAQDELRKSSYIKPEYPNVNLFLDYAWIFLEMEEITQVLNVISLSLDSTYRRITYNVEYPFQKETLCVLHALVKHPSTRRHLISKVFFKNFIIHNFLHIKPLDDKNLSHLIPVVCWEHEKNKDESDQVAREEEVRDKYLASIKTMYDSITEVEQIHLSLLRVLVTNSDGTALQASSRKLFLKELRDFLIEHTLLIFRHKSPKILGPTLCSNFYQLVSLLQVLWTEELPHNHPVLVPIRKFCDDGWTVVNHPRLGGSYRSFMNDEWEQRSSDISNVTLTSNIGVEGTSLELLRYSGPDDSQDSISDNIPLTLLISSTNLQSDLPQVVAGINLTLPSDEQPGALPLGQEQEQRVQYLSQVEQQEAEPVVSQEQQRPNLINQEQPILQAVDSNQMRSSEPIDSVASNQQERSPLNQAQLRSHPMGQVNMLVTPGNADSKQSLVELLNSIVLLYNYGVNQQLVKVATIKPKMRQYVKCYDDYKLHKRDDPVAAELDKYYEACRENIDMQGRHVAWILSAIYSPSKQLQLAWLLRVIIRTLENGSEKGLRFKFVPCFYVESMLRLTSMLRTHFETLASLSKVPDSFDLLKSIAEFLATHVPDERIRDKGIKDALQESAASFFSSPLTLKAMESVSDENKESFIRALLKAYQGTNWAQTNWILIRIWHGSGFAFRYTQSPHLSKFGSDLVETDLSSNLISIRNVPCPSSVYQEKIQRLLLDDSNVESSSFLNSLLNQLNWAFSEFIGMLQIIQNQTSDRVALQNRHILITATCFEILVCLLRVLEMVIVLARPLFTDPSRQNAANMLERLVQFLSQLLLRCSSSGGCFNFILNLDIRAPEILTLDHFPILSAVAGILVALLGDETRLDTDGEEISSIPPVTRVLLSENFPHWSLKFMLNEGNDNDNDNTSNKNKKPFSFETYKEDVSEEEIAAIRRVIASLQLYQKRLSTASELNDDDNKCAICYNYNNSAKFEPCGHESCKSCINHHLLNNHLCFFCKTQITRVLELETGIVLHDFTQNLRNPT